MTSTQIDINLDYKLGSKSLILQYSVG